MKPNTIGRIFWFVEFINICIASRILTTVDSCPCRPPSECLNTSEIRYNISQVLILPCESEDLVRCCSIVSKPIESVDTGGSLQDQENKLEENDGMDLEVDSSEMTLQSNVLPLEESSNIPVLSLNDSSFSYPLQYVHHEQKSVKHEEPIIRQRDQFVTPEVFTQDDQEESFNQVLIDRATSFESHRTSPRQPVSFQIRDSKKQGKESLVRSIDPTIAERVILNKGYHSNVNYGFPSIPKSSSEKISDLFERKTSLETPLTLDEVSTRAIIENASSVSKLDALQRDDTSIRNLSYPEDAGDVKRVVRSRASKLNEKSRKEMTKGSDNSSNSLSMSNANAKTMDRIPTESIPEKGFKRLTRILSTRNLRN